jgi:hypothetical protein
VPTVEVADSREIVPDTVSNAPGISRHDTPIRITQATVNVIAVIRAFVRPTKASPLTTSDDVLLVVVG